jgi:hypothetical protein
MANKCRMTRHGSSTEASWRREGEHLVLSPLSGMPLSLPLGEVCGIGGDGYSILLRSAQGDVQLDRLGADGPGLLQDLRRDWTPLRAGLLRLSDGKAPARIYKGQVQGPQGSGPCRGFLAEDRFLYAVDGEDLVALALADCQQVVFDAAAYCIRCAGWEQGTGTVFSKLGGETAACTELLRQARGQLAAEADSSLARHLPTLAADARAALASHWLPGRLLSLAELERLAPGFQAAFAASWLAHSHRAREGQALMQGLAAGDCWLGYGRPGRSLAPQAAPAEQPQLLWLLVRGEPNWSLELLSQGDYATYLFAGGPELPRLISGLVQFPAFSREALYMPLADLVEDRARYAIAARELPLLRELRACFAGRRIHAART